MTDDAAQQETDEQPVVTSVAELLRRQDDLAYREFVRGPTMSLGLFAAGADYQDVQSPHDQDEVYVVVNGDGVINVAGADRRVAEGSVIYVPRGTRTTSTASVRTCGCSSSSRRP